jgi:hypothetical protein
MRWIDPFGVGFLATAAADLVRYVTWFVTGGLVAAGAVQCAGYRAYQGWADEHPSPRIRTRADWRLRREVTRGIAELEGYLAARVDVGPEPRTAPDPLASEPGDTPS